jgi:hypothetical protein
MFKQKVLSNKRCDPKLESWWINWFETDTSALIGLKLVGSE